MDERIEFFRDLAALRARRGLSLAEIAERTQFPADTLAAVESGPEAPPLPALEAYLRGCGVPLAAWEDRWRQLDQGAAPVVACDGDLPVREAGTSPLAAAGAALAGAADAGGAAYTIKRLGNGGSRKRLPGMSRPRAASWPAAASRRRVPALRYAAAASAAVLLAVGGVALLAWGHAAGHRGIAGAAPRSAGAPTAGAPSAGAAPLPRGRPPQVRQCGAPPIGDGARSAPAHGARPHRPSGSPGRRPAAARREVAGVGCPQHSVTLADAPTGPGWTASDGGWGGDGCDGSAVWTMDPNGNQPAPSALTWTFGLAAGVSHCTLAVFVPTVNALGVGEYAVSTGAAATVSVAVSQAAAAGQWVTLGSYPVRGSSLQIQVAPAVGAAPAGAPGSWGAWPWSRRGPGTRTPFGDRGVRGHGGLRIAANRSLARTGIASLSLIRRSRGRE